MVQKDTVQPLKSDTNMDNLTYWSDLYRDFFGNEKRKTDYETILEKNGIKFIIEKIISKETRKYLIHEAVFEIRTDLEDAISPKIEDVLDLLQEVIEEAIKLAIKTNNYSGEKVIWLSFLTEPMVSWSNLPGQDLARVSISEAANSLMNAIINFLQTNHTALLSDLKVRTIAILQTKIILEDLLFPSTHCAAIPVETLYSPSFILCTN